MGTIALISVIFVALAVFLLSFSLIFRGKKEFPSTHVDSNLALRSKGVKCAREQMDEAYRRKNLSQRLEG